jgi:PEP-CTERM motif
MSCLKMLKMKFRLAALVAVLLAAFSVGNCKASSFYNLTLTNTIGPEGGSGSFTIDGPIANTGLSVFTAGHGLTSLNFSIDGSSFSLANELLNSSVIFNDGNLINVAYLGSLNGFNLDLGTFGLNYGFVDLVNASLDSFGSISGSPVSATPLPPSWTLMLIGLAGFGLVAYRRKRRLSLEAA